MFANRKRDVSSLNRFLQGVGLNARDIHGDLEQVHRQATLDAFKADEVDFLVATDVAARGLDISDMPVVINFDVPFNTDDYVHRIGRTGRAGKSGRAFTLATPDEGQVGGGDRAADRQADPRRARGAEAWRRAATARRSRRRVAAPRAARPAARGGGRRRACASRSSAVERSRPSPSRGAEPLRRSRSAGTSAGRRATRDRPAPSARPPPARPRREAASRSEARSMAFGEHTPRFLLRPGPGGARRRKAKARRADADDLRHGQVRARPRLRGGRRRRAAIEQVSEVYSISGQYDLIMKFHLDEEVDIGRFVTTQVQTLPGVKDTFTLITFKAFT